jgi:hypothetical protein
MGQFTIIALIAEESEESGSMPTLRIIATGGENDNWKPLGS